MYVPFRPCWSDETDTSFCLSIPAANYRVMTSSSSIPQLEYVKSLEKSHLCLPRMQALHKLSSKRCNALSCSPGSRRGVQLGSRFSATESPTKSKAKNIEPSSLLDCCCSTTPTMDTFNSSKLQKYYVAIQVSMCFRSTGSDQLGQFCVDWMFCFTALIALKPGMMAQLCRVGRKLKPKTLAISFPINDRLSCLPSGRIYSTFKRGLLTLISYSTFDASVWQRLQSMSWNKEAQNCIICKGHISMPHKLLVFKVVCRFLKRAQRSIV